jgi:hypothetical protein
MFDLFVLEKDTRPEDLPQEGTFYLVTADGLYIHRDEILFKSLVKIKHCIPHLGTINPQVTMKVDKIPGDVLYKARLFFRHVFKRLHAESELDLHYHKEKKEYLLVCRNQTVSHGSVNYGLLRRDLVADKETKERLLQLSEQGYWRVGTIHSHCDFNAFHSGTDRHDESVIDGIHITVGHVDKKCFSLAASIVDSDNRFSIDPETMVLGIERSQQQNPGHRSDEAFFVTTLSEEEQVAIRDAFQPTLDEWSEIVVPANQGWFFGGGKKTVTQTVYEDKTPFSRVPTLTLTKTVEEPVEGEPVLEDIPTAEVVEGQPPTEIVQGQPVATTVPILGAFSEKELQQVRSHASALKNHSSNIPTSRIRELVQTLEWFFGRAEITAEDINLAVRINPGRRSYEETA